jgi:hypothetical protein
MTASNKLIQASAGNVAGGDFYPYTVDYSCRFYGNDKLTWTAPSGGNRKTFTISLWAKPAMDGTSSVFFNVDGSGAGDSFGVYHQDTGGFYAFGYSAALSYYQRQQINQLYRDPSAWYHWVFAYDTTAATTADRFKIYVNGVELDQSNWTNTTTFPLNADTGWNESGRPHEIGEYADDVSSTDTHMYMAQFAVVDGQQLDASSFGEFKNGIWVPKDLSGLTFGTNGFWLDFSNSAALGTDVSGNGNNFTVSGLTSSDQMIDTPTNNFATYNPLDLVSTPLLSEGNTKLETPNSTQATCTMLPRTGKWYWEVMSPNLWNGVGTTGYRGVVGITKNPAKTIDANQTVQIYMGDGYGANVAGRILKYGSQVKAGVTSTTDTNDIIGILYDADNLTLEFFINNVSWYEVTGLDNKQHLPFVQGDGTPSTSQNTEWNMNFGNNGDFNGNKTAQGNADENGYGDFYYTPPTGALALCTANLPEPAIGPNSTTKTDEVFAPILYTGNGTSQSISTLDFQPDFTWIKNRDAADNHMLFDAVRGATKYSNSNTTDAEATDAQSLSSFNSNGFSVGSNVAVNTNAEDYVAWNWKGNGSGVSNTDGATASTVSANTDAGFSIVTYTGTGSVTTVGHGLGVTPNFIIVKARDEGAGYNWCSYSSMLGPTYNTGGLDVTSAADAHPNYWANTAPTSSVFTVSTYGVVNDNGGQMLAYCFAEVEGFSSFGSYIGNGSADGSFIYTGFRPAFVMVKRTDSTASWLINDAKRDTYNLVTRGLFPNGSGAEATGYDSDFLSNGFKIRDTTTIMNASGGTYIYMAFAEMPFKYSVGR